MTEVLEIQEKSELEIQEVDRTFHLRLPRMVGSITPALLYISIPDFPHIALSDSPSNEGFFERPSSP